MAQLKPCKTPGCHTLVSLAAVRCSLHAAAMADHRAHGDRVYGYHRTAWRRTRRLVLERAGHQCELELDARCTRRATHVHLDPALDGRHDAATSEDCKAACAHCNGAVDAPRAHESLR